MKTNQRRIHEKILRNISEIVDVWIPGYRYGYDFIKIGARMFPFLTKFSPNLNFRKFALTNILTRLIFD